MEVDAADCPCNLVEADIIEPFEARPIYLLYSMIRDEKVLFPSHKDVLLLRAIFVMEVRLLRLFCQGTPRRKTSPMLHISLVCGAPRFVLGLECVLWPYNLSLEVGDDGGKIWGEL